MEVSNRLKQDDDKYAIEMIIKEQRQKQRRGFKNEVKMEVSSSHKRLLATTIRNTSSYNQAVIRGDIIPQNREVEVKKKKKKAPKKLVERFHPSAVDDGDLAPPTAESFKKLSALVSHSKLKSKKRKTDIDLEDFLGQHVDQGVFGPMPGRVMEQSSSSGQPNVSLPEKCPW
jgi:hypothetical protein